MKILLYCPFGYYDHILTSSGLTPCALPSGSGTSINHSLAQGLTELGHEVYYYLKDGINGELPEKMKKIQFVDEIIEDADVFHNYVPQNRPYLFTQHSSKYSLDAPLRQNIFVSNFLANFFQSDRYVYNGIEPDEYIYSETKEDYFLWLSPVSTWSGEKRYLAKGLDIALALRKKMGFRLVVAGGATQKEMIEEVATLCKNYGAEYIGDVRGKDKARWLANAKGLIFPTRLPEAFGLVSVEAMVSGTPVITSIHGASSEIVSPETGFTCKTEADYIRAIETVGAIDSKKCRAKVLNNYHYLQMAAGYYKEYEKELSYWQKNKGYQSLLV